LRFNFKAEPYIW